MSLSVLFHHNLHLKLLIPEWCQGLNLKISVWGSTFGVTRRRNKAFQDYFEKADINRQSILMHFLMEDMFVLIQMSLRFVPRGQTDDKSALVQAKTWCRTGNNPLHNAMLIKAYDSIWRH